MSEEEEPCEEFYDEIHCMFCNHKEKCKENFQKPRVWCTKCDIDLENKGIALDCPEDGIFYECPKCNYRIVIFRGGV